MGFCPARGGEGWGCGRARAGVGPSHLQAGDLRPPGAHPGRERAPPEPPYLRAGPPYQKCDVFVTGEPMRDFLLMVFFVVLLPFFVFVLKDGRSGRNCVGGEIGFCWEKMKI